MEFQDAKVIKAFSQRRGRKKLAQFLVHNVILMYLLILNCMRQDVKKSCRNHGGLFESVVLLDRKTEIQDPSRRKILVNKFFMFTFGTPSD